MINNSGKYSCSIKIKTGCKIIHVDLNLKNNLSTGTLRWGGVGGRSVRRSQTAHAEGGGGKQKKTQFKHTEIRKEVGKVLILTTKCELVLPFALP